MTDWNRLWATELEPADLRPAQVLMFLKSPMRLVEEPLYGFVDALISALDRTPFTHTGLVASVTDDRVRIVHSDMRGIRHTPLERSATPHRFGDLFVFEPIELSEASRQTIAEQAVERAGASPSTEDASYPFADMFFLACLMRLRSLTGYDEQLHRRIADVADAVTALSTRTGRMCAPFVASVFAQAGVPLAPPSERAIIEADLLNPDLVSDRMRSVEAITDTGMVLGTLRDDLAQLLDALGDRRGRPEAVREFRAFVDRLDDPGVQHALGEWLLGPDDSHETITAMLMSACEGLERSLHREPPDHLAERFVSCHDLVLSPSLAPVGHVRMWHRRISATQISKEVRE